MNPGPDFIPRIGSVLLFICSLFVLREGIRSLKVYAPEGETAEEKNTRKISRMNVLKSGMLIGLYVIVFEKLGFLVSSAAYLFFQMMQLARKKDRKPLLFVVIALLFSAIVYFVFTRFLFLMLPRGIINI